MPKFVRLIANGVTTWRSNLTIAHDMLKQGNWSQVDSHATTQFSMGNWLYGGDKFDVLTY